MLTLHFEMVVQISYCYQLKHFDFAVSFWPASVSATCGESLEAIDQSTANFQPGNGRF